MIACVSVGHEHEVLLLTCPQLARSTSHCERVHKKFLAMREALGSGFLSLLDNLLFDTTTVEEGLSVAREGPR